MFYNMYVCIYMCVIKHIYIYYVYIYYKYMYILYIYILLEGVNMWPVANTSNFHDWYFHFLICGSPDSSPGMT